MASNNRRGGALCTKIGKGVFNSLFEGTQATRDDYIQLRRLFTMRWTHGTRDCFLHGRMHLEPH